MNKITISRTKGKKSKMTFTNWEAAHKVVCKILSVEYQETDDHEKAIISLLRNDAEGLVSVLLNGEPLDMANTKFNSSIIDSVVDFLRSNHERFEKPDALLYNKLMEEYQVLESKLNSSGKNLVYQKDNLLDILRSDGHSMFDEDKEEFKLKDEICKEVALLIEESPLMKEYL